MKTNSIQSIGGVASARTAAAADRNPGIVPPWLQHPGQWRNPGIVPPWLQGRPVGPSHPVADDVPRIMGSTEPTVYDPNPVVLPVVPDPDEPRIWGR